MDYEKKYKEALQRAKDFENGEVHYAINKGENIMHWIFPELRESEDERIRKAIKKALQVRCDGSRIISDEPVTLEEAIAWLEKQGEQKPTWSDEDVAMLDSAIAFVSHSPFTVIGKGKSNVIAWLKSLKDRYTWKPSEEQIKALNEVLNFAANHESSHWNDYIFGTLNNLIRQLKKLKG